MSIWRYGASWSGLTHLAGVALLGGAVLYGGLAFAKTCQTAHSSCWTSMPVGGFCECKVHDLTASGVVVMQKGSVSTKSQVTQSQPATMPDDASAETYLRIAQSAFSAGDSKRVDVALGRAETALLSNVYVAGSTSGGISTPAISAIRQARTDLATENYGAVSTLIQKALNDVAGKQGAGGASKSGLLPRARLIETPHKTLSALEVYDG